jgi:hypothetical protein
LRVLTTEYQTNHWQSEYKITLSTKLNILKNLEKLTLTFGFAVVVVAAAAVLSDALIDAAAAAGD